MTPVLAPGRKSSPSGRTRPSGSPVGYEPFDLYEYLFQPKFFKTLPCVLGILIGFLSCSVAGAVVAKTNFYGDFHRFHEFISPSTLYYPTVSQMVAIVESQSKPDRTIVIVGGNSIFNGIGQRASELWTDQLRTDLGHKFAVFNFASPGSLSFEGAYWAAESLLARGRKVVYVTVAMPTLAGAPEGGKVYGYLYWDAHEKHLLAQSREREALIERRLSTADEKEKTRVADLKLRMQLDNVCHFQDLWTAIGYSKVFTVWTDLTASNPFRPRRKYGDIQPCPLPVEKRFGMAKELAVVRSYCDGFFAITPSAWRPREDAWERLSREMKELIPDQFKKNCLVVIAGNPPYYLSRVTSAERARIRMATKMSEQRWAKAGYHAAAVGERFTNEDYRDCWHLVGAGGKKVSALVARQVLAIDKELGFDRNSLVPGGGKQ